MVSLTQVHANTGDIVSATYQNLTVTFKYLRILSNGPLCRKLPNFLLHILICRINVIDVTPQIEYCFYSKETLKELSKRKMWVVHLRSMINPPRSGHKRHVLLLKLGPINNNLWGCSTFFEHSRTGKRFPQNYLISQERINFRLIY